jgi:hypothetical protein
MATERPIQYVTNARTLRKPREVNPGGSQKDFFKGKNQDFQRHRDKLASSLSEISSQLATEHAAFHGVGYVEVRLAREAWAKSHRPIDKLFTSKRAVLAGSADIAELLFRIDAKKLDEVAEVVKSAQSEPTVKENSETKKKIEVVSEVRSETGAIETVALWGSTERAVPSVEDAIAYMKKHGLAASYRVELFERVGRPVYNENIQRRDPLVLDFWKRLKRLAAELPMAMSLLPYKDSQHPIVGLTLLSGEPRLVVVRERELVGNRELLGTQPNFVQQHHVKLLRFLSGHPLVKSVDLPGAFELPAEETFVTSKATDASAAIRMMSVKSALRRGTGPGANAYPLVCVVDGGISKQFNPWIVYEYRAKLKHDESHGSNIASLLVLGKTLNPALEDYLEDDGCLLIDMALQPQSANPTLYPAGALSLLDLLDAQLKDVKKSMPLRVINFSLNVERVPEGKKASETARRLDEIARKHDVIFVVSAGNADGANMRPEWPSSTTTALQQLASAAGDRLYEPADTLFNVSVAALNALGTAPAISKAPARYSRRGGNLRVVKPDFAHIGGTHARNRNTGLSAMDASGGVRYVCGTSYSAPFIAKTLAALDRALDYRAPREVLLALLYHHASVHDPLAHKDLISQARQLVGFGLPLTSEQILRNSSSSYTFVFYERLKVDECLQREFTWPKSLVSAGGKCSGKVRATLVSSPPLAHRFGAEAARVNVDFDLQQATGKRTKKGRQSFEGRVKAVALANLKGGTADQEARKVLAGLKWSPVKVYEGDLEDEGVSSTFRLNVGYLERDRRQNIPDDGVPVAIVVTVEDKDGKAPVYNEMHATLGAAGLKLNDIRAALRAIVKS